MKMGTKLGLHAVDCPGHSGNGRPMCREHMSRLGREVRVQHEGFERRFHLYSISEQAVGLIENNIPISDQQSLERPQMRG